MPRARVHSSDWRIRLCGRESVPRAVRVHSHVRALWSRRSGAAPFALLREPFCENLSGLRIRPCARGPLLRRSYDPYARCRGVHRGIGRGRNPCPGPFPISCAGVEPARMVSLGGGFFLCTVPVRCASPRRLPAVGRTPRGGAILCAFLGCPPFLSATPAPPTPLSAPRVPPLPRPSR